MSTLLSLALPLLGCALMMLVCMAAMFLMGHRSAHADDEADRTAP